MLVGTDSCIVWVSCYSSCVAVWYNPNRQNRVTRGESLEVAPMADSCIVWMDDVTVLVLWCGFSDLGAGGRG